jgi:hypothetical protein
MLKDGAQDLQLTFDARDKQFSFEVNRYLSVNSSSVCRITSAKTTNSDTVSYGY